MLYVFLDSWASSAISPKEQVIWIPQAEKLLLSVYLQESTDERVRIFTFWFFTGLCIVSFFLSELFTWDIFDVLLGR